MATMLLPLRATRTDGVVVGIAVLAWVACLLFGTASPLGTTCLVVAGAATALALSGPWQRQRMAMAIDAAARVGEMGRADLMATAAAHAARWQVIVDTAIEGIVSIGSDGQIETVNGAAERLFGYTQAELLGRNVSMLMPEPYRSEHDAYLRRYLTTGERRIIGIGREVTGLRKDGTVFPLHLAVGAASIGERRFFMAVLRDISQDKDIQMKLAQTERLAAVGELAAGVAHEVNNPINTIINCAQLIADGDDLKSNCQVITEEGQRIAEIVQDLLRFARDDRDRPQPTSLPEVVQRTLRLVGENWKRHGIALTVDVPLTLPLVQARPQQLQQVLLNLLINAKDALVQGHCENRKVSLAASPVRNGVQFCVTDNGPGIPAHLGQRIFEPFVTTKRARGGTGLGLSISKSIVEGYGGTIGVESTPGHGATFCVWLPQSTE
jgi:two-component system sensor kinase FixL